MIVFATRDVALLRGLLERDRVGGAYLVGDLDPPFVDKGRWFVAVREGAPVAIVLLFTAFADPVILSFGEVRGVAEIVGALFSGPKVRGAEGPKVRRSEGPKGRCRFARLSASPASR